MSEITELQEQIKVVGKARAEAQKLAEKRKTMYDEFMSQHTDFFAEVATAASRVTEVEDVLRELTLAVYRETGEKKPCEGVAIREVTKLDYAPDKAYLWAIEHTMALSLDKKAFEAIAKTTPLDFVTTTTEPQATIATDLTGVLE